MTFLTQEHGQGLLTLCVSEGIIAWTPEHETGGSANRLRHIARGRNQLHFLFIHSPPSTLPAPVPGICPPPASSSPFPSGDALSRERADEPLSPPAELWRAPSHRGKPTASPSPLLLSHLQYQLTFNLH